MKLKGVFFFTLAFVAAGCGDDIVTGEALLTCDITKGNCQRGIYASVAERLGLDPGEAPPVRTISVEQFEEELYEELEAGELEEDAYSHGLRLMGFLPDEPGSLLGNQLDYLLQNVAAYYSSNTAAITVIDRDYEDWSAQGILAHEFVHAIQDRQFGFRTIWKDVETEDSTVATRSVIEGDAQHASYDWLYQVAGLTLSRADWAEFHDNIKENILLEVRNPETRLMDAASLFPYGYGFEFMSEAYFAGDLEAREALWKVPPRTTLAILFGYETFASGEVDEERLWLPAHPSPVEGYASLGDTELGAFYFYAFLLRYGLTEADAWELMSAMTGDTFDVYEASSGVVSVWRIGLSDELLADGVREAIAAAERPVSWSATWHEEAIYVIAAEDDETRLGWETQLLNPIEQVPSEALAGVAAVEAALQRPRRRISVGTCLGVHGSMPSSASLLRR